MLARCLVLGGGGFIGANLVKELLKNRYYVKVFDKKNFSKVNLLEFDNQIDIVEGDFGNSSDLSKAIDSVDYVFHLISTTLPSTSLDNIIYDIESNVIPSVQVLKICFEKKVKKVIFISSGGTIYGLPKFLPITENHPINPITSYGIVKSTIEHYFELYRNLWGIDCCIFRLSNPYGKKQNPKGIQGIIPVLLYKAINNLELEIWGDGEIIRDYIHIEDVVRILVQSVQQYTPEVIYNLGSGNGTSLNQLISIVKNKINPKLKVTYLENRNFDVPSNVLDISLIKKRFSFEEKFSLEEGIINLHKYLKGK
jgi:UDP-glucose 4-epimerase